MIANKNAYEAWQHLKVKYEPRDEKTYASPAHVATQQQFRYHVKHALSILDGYNQHSTTDPWYEVGQGAGDACSWWIIQANSLTLAYLTKADMWYLTSPDNVDCASQGFNMFVDDTDLVSMAMPNQSAVYPIHTVQTNLNLWNAFLQASSGELNPSKCIWLHFFW